MYYLNQTELLERGWTLKMINALLPAPELEENPKYKRAAPTKLWDIETIEEIEKTEEYKIMYEKVERRREAAQKAVETKRKKTEQIIDEAINQLTIIVYPYDAVVKMALQDKREWYRYQNSIRGYERFDTDFSDIDTNTKQRWTVNFIRHNLTNYEDILEQIRGKTGINTQYYRLKQAIHDMIYTVYPELSN